MAITTTSPASWYHPTTPQEPLWQEREWANCQIQTSLFGSPLICISLDHWHYNQPPPSSKALLLFPLIPHYCVSLKPAIPYLFPLGTSQFLPPLTSVKPKFDLLLLVLTPWMISCNPAVSTMPFIQVSSMSPLQPRPRPEPKGLPPTCLVNPWKVGSPEPSSLSPLPHTPPHGGWRHQPLDKAEPSIPSPSTSTHRQFYLPSFHLHNYSSTEVLSSFTWTLTTAPGRPHLFLCSTPMRPPYCCQTIFCYPWFLNPSMASHHLPNEEQLLSRMEGPLWSASACLSGSSLIRLLIACSTPVISN